MYPVQSVTHLSIGQRQLLNSSYRPAYSQTKPNNFQFNEVLLSSLTGQQCLSFRF